MKEDIRESVLRMMEVNLGAGPREKVLVLTDYPDQDQWCNLDYYTLKDMAERSLLAKAVHEIISERYKANFLAYPATGRHGAEPPDYVGKAMLDFDVVVAITTYSISHTEAREKATSKGVRVASMPTFTADMFMPGGPMDVDYRKVAELCERLAKELTGSKVIVESENGTRLTLSIEGRVWNLDTGLLTSPGSFGNLPAGEVFIAPVEGTAEGRVVVQRGWFPNLKEDMVLEVEKGLVVDVKGGGDVGDKFRELLAIGREPSEVELHRRNVAELGVGTNPNAKRPDNVLEAEKILGTVHVAIGDNSHFGGRVSADMHVDFVIPKPTLKVDEKVIRLEEFRANF